jgi:Domain of unknown function (DUF4386)
MHTEQMHTERKTMSNGTTGRAIGALILTGYVWGVGNAMVQAVWNAPDGLNSIANNQMQISAGAVVMLLNSVVVIGIGLLMMSVLKHHHSIQANGYLVARVVEGAFLAVGVVFLLLLIPLGNEYLSPDATAGKASLASLAVVFHMASHYAAQVAWISLGTGSMLLCRAM